MRTLFACAYALLLAWILSHAITIRSEATCISLAHDLDWDDCAKILVTELDREARPRTTTYHSWEAFVADLLGDWNDVGLGVESIPRRLK